MFTEKFEEALVYAAQTHRTQIRKGANIPYISHLMAVSALVIENGGDEEQAIAALLHDAAEDHGGQARLDDIREKFSDRVADIVAACTDSLADTTKGEKKEPWRIRKERYLKHIAEMSDDAALVSLADKTHNAHSILRDRNVVGEEIWDRFNAGKEDSLWYYQSVAEAFRKRLPGSLSDELTDTVNNFHSND